MKRILIGLGSVAFCGGIAMLLMASRYESRIKPNTRVGIIDVGGLAPADAARKLRVWWETERRRELSLQVPNGRKAPYRASLTALGVRLDDMGSVAELPMDDFWGSAVRTISQNEGELKQFEPKLRVEESAVPAIDAYVKESIGEPRPARVLYENGQIKREPEVSGYSLDREGFLTALQEGLKGNGTVEIPIKEAPKRLPDEELDKISEVVSSFSTKFPAGQASRNTNLRLASGRINGTILMPGEVFSFNGVVGKRLASDGYRVAGVYRNGRHDVALAGGICQVSGTLYNAVLMANLKIRERTNHSMPVAYLPVGRDATVDYGTKDLKFENNTDHPIAIFSTYEPGRLTFGVLGQKEPGVEVKIVTAGHRSWGRGVKYVTDNSLPPGKTKVVEKGSSGHWVQTYRVVTKNGVEIKRENLGSSHYGGGVRIVARGPGAASGGEPSPERAGEEPADDGAEGFDG